MSAHPLVKNLDGIRSEFASTIDTIAVKGVRKQVILSSSPFNQVINTPVMLSLQMVEREPDPRTFRNKQQTVGVLLEGSFPSDFSNRPVPEGLTPPHALPEKSAPAKMIVVADGDILKNQVSSTDGSTFPLGYDRYTQQQYGNRNFFLNVVDYLTDDSGIIALRNKEVKMRLLDRARIRSEKAYWQTLCLCLPLLLVLAGGIGQFFYRRRRFGNK